MIWAEQRDGKLANVVYELLGGGRKLAESLGGSLSAVLIGQGVEGLAQDLFEAGAGKVILVEDAQLKDIRDEAYVQVLSAVIAKHQPEAVLFGASVAGRSLAPRVAAKLKVGLSADCTSLEVENGQIKQIRPTYGGNVITTILSARKPVMATIRVKAFAKAGRQAGRSGELIRESVSLDAAKIRTQVVDLVAEVAGKVKLEEADIIVSGGRGLGDPAKFKLVEGLASVLGAAVGASRAAVDAGWYPYAHQVGQTGKTVSPKVYIACGISGAIQHLAGMQSSDIIIAINKNPDAPIFGVATYGIVGDLNEVVPALTEEFRKALS